MPTCLCLLRFGEDSPVCREKQARVGPLVDKALAARAGHDKAENVGAAVVIDSEEGYMALWCAPHVEKCPHEMRRSVHKT